MWILNLNLVAIGGYAAAGEKDQALQKSLQFSDIARKADGTIRYMNQGDAINYCANQGQHLPSARELAQLATSMGAAGILETSVGPGYTHLVRARNADGKVDVFYYSYAGYKPPVGDLGNQWFWSSSREYNDYGFGLYGNYGEIKALTRIHELRAVRCVHGQ